LFFLTKLTGLFAAALRAIPSSSKTLSLFAGFVVLFSLSSPLPGFHLSRLRIIVVFLSFDLTPCDYLLPSTEARKGASLLDNSFNCIPGITLPSAKAKRFRAPLLSQSF